MPLGGPALGWIVAVAWLGQGIRGDAHGWVLAASLCGWATILLEVRGGRLHIRGEALRALALGGASVGAIVAALWQVRGLQPAALAEAPWLLAGAGALAGAWGLVPQRGHRAQAVRRSLSLSLSLAGVWAARLALDLTGALPLARLDALEAREIRPPSAWIDAAGPRGWARDLQRHPQEDTAALHLLEGSPPARPLSLDAVLGLGWRPQYPPPALAPALADALEARGRGGEGLRLLRRYPREGAIDAAASVLERGMGLPVQWKGGALEAAHRLPGEAPMDVWLVYEGASVTVPLDVTAPTTLWVEADAEAFEGPPLVEVRGGGAGWLGSVPTSGRVAVGTLQPGPYRVTLTLREDRVGPGGDRNLHLRRIVGEALP